MPVKMAGPPRIGHLYRRAAFGYCRWLRRLAAPPLDRNSRVYTSLAAVRDARLGAEASEHGERAGPVDLPDQCAARLDLDLGPRGKLAL